MTEAMRVKMKNSLQNEAGSLNTRIPIITVPTAPIPVHIGYAVPIGMVLVALVRSTMLNMHNKTKAAYHSTALFPVSIFPFPRQNVKPVSHRPASISIIQFISALYQFFQFRVVTDNSFPFLSYVASLTIPIP